MAPYEYQEFPKWLTVKTEDGKGQERVLVNNKDEEKNYSSRIVKDEDKDKQQDKDKNKVNPPAGGWPKNET